MGDTFVVELKVPYTRECVYSLKCPTGKKDVFFALLILSLKDLPYLFRFDDESFYNFVDMFCERLILVGVDIERCDSKMPADCTVHVDELMHEGLFVSEVRENIRMTYFREVSYYSDDLYKDLNGMLPQNKRFPDSILSRKLASPSIDLFCEKDFIGKTFRFISPSGDVDFVCEKQSFRGFIVHSAEGHDPEGNRVLIRAFGGGFFFVKYDSLGDVDFTSKTGQLFLVTD